MTEAQFKYIKELHAKIEEKQRVIRTIEALILSHDLTCNISGITCKTVNRTREYFLSNKEEIIKILEIEKAILLKELTELEKIFSEK